MKNLKGWIVLNQWATVFWACAVFWAVVAAVIVLAVL